MEKKRKYWTVALSVLVVAVIAMTVAFAAINSELKITGTGQVNKSTFKVIMADLVGPSLTSDANVDSPAVLTDYKIEGFNAVFTSPNASVSYTFNVKNEGDHDAKIGALTKLIPVCTAADPADEAVATAVCSNLTYSLTYTAGGATVAEGDTLVVDEIKNMTLTLALSGTDLFTAGVEISNLDITLVYVQDL